MEVIEREKFKALNHGFETFVVVGLTCGTYGGKCAAVETGIGGENDWPINAATAMTVFASQLDGGFVGFCTGIAEEHAVCTAVFY